MPEKPRPRTVERNQTESPIQVQALTDYLNSLLTEATETESSLDSLEATRLAIVDQLGEPLLREPALSNTEIIETESLDSTVVYSKSIESKSIESTTIESKPIEPKPIEPKAFVSEAIDFGDIEKEAVNKIKKRISSAADLAEIEAKSKPSIKLESTVPEVSTPDALQNPVIVGDHSENLKAKISDIWQENGRPYWAQERFDCLLFNVGKLRIAAPLVVLGTILKVDTNFTTLAGQPDWSLGIMKNGKTNLQIVDTAKWLMPEKYEAGFKESIRFVISFMDLEWGLACSDVQSAMTMEPGNVKWRVNHKVRPWIAGTVIDEMCCILDMEILRLMLADIGLCQAPITDL
ncbi:MAG: chemotaxis protein CheW [Pseudomonadales bacterium]|nr:chemotaxis protein CheW [Pseudomonadales bacterium]